MERSWRNRLRRLLPTTDSTLEAIEDPHYYQGDPAVCLPIVVVSRSSTPPGSTHWAIAVVTDEPSHQCRVFHVSDTHGHGLRTVVAVDETLDRSSSCQWGVRIGLVHRDNLRHLEEAICRNQLPPPTSDKWDCEHWTLAMIRHLEAQGFLLATGSLDDGSLMRGLIRDGLRAQILTERNHGCPVFVHLSLPRAGH